jgi:hypothetical protein
MKKIIRLTESDLTKLVNRVIEEQEMGKNILSESLLDMNAIKNGVEKLKTCFNPKKYPNVAQVSGGSSRVIFGFILLAIGFGGELFSLGISTIPSAISISAGTMETASGIEKLYRANISKIDNELKALYQCVLG